MTEIINFTDIKKLPKKKKIPKRTKGLFFDELYAKYLTEYERDFWESIQKEPVTKKLFKLLDIKESTDEYIIEDVDDFIQTFITHMYNKRTRKNPEYTFEMGDLCNIAGGANSIPDTLRVIEGTYLMHNKKGYISGLILLPEGLVSKTKIKSLKKMHVKDLLGWVGQVEKILNFNNI